MRATFSRGGIIAEGGGWGKGEIGEERGGKREERGKGELLVISHQSLAICHLKRGMEEIRMGLLGREERRA